LETRYSRLPCKDEAKFAQAPVTGMRRATLGFPLRTIDVACAGLVDSPAQTTAPQRFCPAVALLPHYSADPQPRRRPEPPGGRSLPDRLRGTTLHRYAWIHKTICRQ